MFGLMFLGLMIYLGLTDLGWSVRILASKINHENTPGLVGSTTLVASLDHDIRDREQP
jgi:hypothetical protein